MYVINLSDVTLEDISLVGGKNASIGEMLHHLSKLGVAVPSGFAVTSEAFDDFLNQNNLNELLQDTLKDLNVSDIDALKQAGLLIRKSILKGHFSAALEEKVRAAYQTIERDNPKASFAVRSSATAEDLPDASFAGQQETFLNVSGLSSILEAIKKVFASLYNDRAIAYRVHQGYEKMHVSISAGIQLMVRSDLATSGVMFTLDTESGFEDVIFITASYGLGEMIVQGAVNPDEFYVYKRNFKQKKPAVLNKILGSKRIKMVYNSSPNSAEPVKQVDVSESDQCSFSIDEADIQTLSDYALKIEEHYKRPMDIEWAKDGQTGKIFIVQARPETVKSRDKNNKVYKRYQINSDNACVLVTGRSIGDRIGSGVVRKINSIDEINLVQKGDILVTDMTDPDWEPVMKKTAAIVTNRGGRTCHAAIIARELGIPAVVGTGNATDVLDSGLEVTVSCAEGDTGMIYKGLLPFETQNVSIESMPEIPTKIMMNIANPDLAFSLSRLPNCGVGLARLEFMINRVIGVHPRALLEIDSLSKSVQEKIYKKIQPYKDGRRYFIEKLQYGIATIAAAFSPKPIILRLSDFKTNEYASMMGGSGFEPNEENPMIGFRGASRYLDKDFQSCFQMECEAIKHVRDVMGFHNIIIMVPFVRTLQEAESIIELMASNGLVRGENDLKIIMMCELPSNAILADEFLEFFDGFSIGSNDMTQLTLGLDRDSGMVAHLFDERNLAVKKMIEMAVSACLKQNKYIGICGQGPSDHIEFAHWLLGLNITSISLNSDTVVQTWSEISALSGQ